MKKQKRLASPSGAQYVKPQAKIIRFDKSGTTVLGNCTGWKSGITPGVGGGCSPCHT